LNNINSSTGTDNLFERILTTNYNYGEVLAWSNSDTDKKFLIYNKHIDYIRIEITDDENRSIDFNGLPFQVSFTLYYEFNKNYVMNMRIPEIMGIQSDLKKPENILSDNNNNDEPI